MNSHIYTGNSPVTSVPSWPNVIQVQQTLDAASDCDEDDEVCCQCNKWSPPGLKTPDLQIVKSGGSSKCSHWLHLECVVPVLQLSKKE